MSGISFNKRDLFVVLTIIITSVIFRVLFKIPNVTPVAAIALFGGALIKRKDLAIVLPLIIMFLSDLIIGFYSPFLMFGVYTSFVFITLIGFLLRKNPYNFLKIITASISSSVLFFIVTNFFVWAEGLWYPLNLQGLLQCYTLAIPFFKYELFGTLAFNIFFFTSFILVFSKQTLFASIKSNR